MYIRLKRQMEHLERALATYVYNHCNMCNITIYFFNIHMKHLQHISETSETIKTYSCNMHFQRNISLLLGRTEARRCVVFTGGSGPVAFVGGGPTAVVARCGKEASAARAAERLRPRDLERAAARRAWQGRQPHAVTRRRPRAVLSKASAQAVHLGGLAATLSKAGGEWIRTI